MSKPRIAITRRVFQERVDALSQHYEVVTNESDTPLRGNALQAHLQGCVGVLCDTGTPITAELIAALPQLRVMSNIAVGYDNLPIPALTAAGVMATNTPDVLTQATADHAWALLMAAARRVCEADRFVRDGLWSRWEFDGWLGAPVHGATLGIVGMGRIGAAIAQRAAGFQMQVLYHNRTQPEHAAAPDQPLWCPLDDVLTQSDFIVLVVPGGTGTKHMIGAQHIARMKPNAILINIARGGVVDDNALIDALTRRAIAGAGLDVFENEPALDERFLTLPNVALTPHIGSATYATRLAMLDRAIKNLTAALSGQVPPDLINTTLIHQQH